MRAHRRPRDRRVPVRDHRRDRAAHRRGRRGAPASGRAIVSSVANGYCGYCTTAEEYELQYYEGGHNLHGPTTQAWLAAQSARLARESPGPGRLRRRRAPRAAVRAARAPLPGPRGDGADARAGVCWRRPSTTTRRARSSGGGDCAGSTPRRAICDGTIPSSGSRLRTRRGSWGQRGRRPRRRPRGRPRRRRPRAAATRTGPLARPVARRRAPPPVRAARERRPARGGGPRRLTSRSSFSQH